MLKQYTMNKIRVIPKKIGKENWEIQGNYPNRIEIFQWLLKKMNEYSEQ